MLDYFKKYTKEQCRQGSGALYTVNRSTKSVKNICTYIILQKKLTKKRMYAEKCSKYV